MATCWDDYVAPLTSGSMQKRTKAFNVLRPMLIQGTFGLPDESQKKKLIDALLESDDGQESKVLLQILTWINSKPHAPTAEKELVQVDTPLTAAAWFWKPLSSNSKVFRAWEKNRRRDEDAMLNLARFLSSKDFPNVQFERVTLQNYDWGKVLTSDLEAAVFIGRLGIYGGSVRTHFEQEHWFRFLSDKRPEKLGPNDFDPQYHRICAENEAEEDEPRYLTHEENDGIRTDYGLVQRYTVRYQGGLISVIGLWGCSTLGTMAAVQWAIDLEKNTDPLPNAELKTNTTLEALVSVRADTCKYPYTWSPEPVQLEELHIGYERWDIARKCWGFLLNTKLEWKPTRDGAGLIKFNGETRRTSGLIAKIIDKLAKKKLKQDSAIDLSKILSKTDLAKWKRDGGTLGGRIKEYSFGGIVPDGGNRLRVLMLIEIL